MDTGGGRRRCVCTSPAVQRQQAARALFGSLQAGPVLSGSNPVVNGASFLPGIAEYSWITIKGSSLSATARTWNAATDFVNGALPTQLDGVSVTVDEQFDGYLYFIEPGSNQRSGAGGFHVRTGSGWW